MKIRDLEEAVYAKAIIAYHGTSSSRLRSILKTGMNPTPPSRVWDKDDSVSINTASRKSLDGSYWTTNLSTATMAAINAGQKFDGTEWRDNYGLIVIAQIVEQSAKADEDSINFDLSWAWADMMRSVLRTSPDAVNVLATAFYYPRAERDTFRHDMIKTFIQNAHEKLKTSDVQPAPIALLRATFFSIMNRLFAHSNPTDSYYTPFRDIPEAERPVIPTVADAEQEFLKVRDAITRFYKKTAYKAKDSFSHTFRMTDPVGFSGSNRIIAIVQYPYVKPGPLVLAYGKSVPDDFIQQWETRKGKFPGLVDKSENVLIKSNIQESFSNSYAMYWVNPRSGEVETNFSDHGEAAMNMGFGDREKFYSENESEAEEAREEAIWEALQNGWVRAEYEGNNILDLEAMTTKLAQEAAKLITHPDTEAINLSVNGELGPEGHPGFSVTIPVHRIRAFIRGGKVITEDIV